MYVAALGRHFYFGEKKCVRKWRARWLDRREIPPLREPFEDQDKPTRSEEANAKEKASARFGWNDKFSSPAH
jgi:hypothetical protein